MATTGNLPKAPALRAVPEPQDAVDEAAVHVDESVYDGGPDDSTLVGAPNERGRIVEGQDNLEKPLGVDVAPVIMLTVNKVTDAVIAECDKSVEQLNMLREQVRAHAQRVSDELDARDNYVKQLLIDHGVFAGDAEREFRRITTAAQAIADSHVIEDGKPIPTSSNT